MSDWATERAKRLAALAEIDIMMDEYERSEEYKQSDHYIRTHPKTVAPLIDTRDVESLVLSAKQVVVTNEFSMQIQLPQLCVEVSTRRVAAYYATGRHISITPLASDFQEAVRQEGLVLTLQVPRFDDRLDRDVARRSEFILAVDHARVDQTPQFNILYFYDETDFDDQLLLALSYMKMERTIHLDVVHLTQDPKISHIELPRDTGNLYVVLTIVANFEDLPPCRDYNLCISDVPGSMSMLSPETRARVRFRHYSVVLDSDMLRESLKDEYIAQGCVEDSKFYLDEKRLVCERRMMRAFNRVSLGTCASCSMLSYTCTQMYTQTFREFYRATHLCPLDRTLAHHDVRMVEVSSQEPFRMVLDGSNYGIKLFAVLERVARRSRGNYQQLRGGLDSGGHQLGTELVAHEDHETPDRHVLRVRVPMTTLFYSRQERWMIDPDHESYTDIVFVSHLEPDDVWEPDKIKAVDVLIRLVDVSAYV